MFSLDPGFPLHMLCTYVASFHCPKGILSQGSGGGSRYVEIDMFSEGLGEFVIRPTVEAEVFRINRPDRSIQRLPI